MFCTECGFKNPDGYARCLKCGSPLETPPTPKVEEKEAPAVEPRPVRPIATKPHKPPKVVLGPDAVRGLARPQYLGAGLLMIFVGLVMVYIGYTFGTVDSTPTSIAIRVLVPFGIIVALVGIVVMAMAWVRTMESIYLRSGYCQITDEKCICSGGCNKCVFALKYIEFNNIDDREVR